MEEMNFGSLLSKKRLEKGYSLRKFAEKMDITASYLSDIEKSRRNPISNLEKLNEIAECLSLSEEERELLLDLAGRGHSGDNVISPDLPEYIMSDDLARIALRKAKNKSLNGDKEGVDKIWQEMIDKLDSD